MGSRACPRQINGLDGMSIYAFCEHLVGQPATVLHRRWEGGDPGVSNQKTPTTILLTPDRKFHSFGYAARDFYHDLDPTEAKHWFYLEKFKMKLHTLAVNMLKTLVHVFGGYSMFFQQVRHVSYMCITFSPPFLRPETLFSTPYSCACLWIQWSDTDIFILSAEPLHWDRYSGSQWEAS